MTNKDLIAKIIENSEKLYNDKLGTTDEYVNIDLTKSCIKYAFSTSELLKYVGIQAGNGSTQSHSYLYRNVPIDDSHIKDGYPTVAFNLVKHDVQFDMTREFNFNIGSDFDENILEFHGIDAKKEREFIFKYEATAEFERYVNSYLVKSAIKSNHMTVLSKDVSAKGLETTMNDLSDKIAADTRRGSANFCIASPKVCKMLLNEFDANETGVGSFTNVGQLNDGHHVLIRDSYSVNDYILIGYSGNQSADNGIVFCLNTMFMLKKSDDGFNCATNFGICSDDKSNDYYHLILLK